MASSFPPSSHIISNDLLSDPGVGMGDDNAFTNGWTAAQIMAVADSIEGIDTEWMSNAMIEHSIW